MKELMDELKKTAHTDQTYERFVADVIIKKHFRKLQNEANIANERIKLLKKLINEV